MKGQCVNRTRTHEVSINKFKRSLLHIKGVRVWKRSSVGAKIFILRWGFINLMEPDDVSIYNRKDLDWMAQIFHNTVSQFWPWLHSSFPFSSSCRLPLFRREAGVQPNDISLQHRYGIKAWI